MIPLTGSVTGWRGRALALGSAAILAAACGGGTQPVVTGGDVALAAGHYALYSGTQLGGALTFPAAGSGGAQYLVVAQFATGTAGVTSSFSLAGSATALPAAALVAPVLRAAPSVAEQFHDMLRQTEARLASQARVARARGVVPGVALAPTVVVPPVFGSIRSFKVCGDMTCTLASMKTVSATAQYVGLHAAIYLDDSLPAGGFTPTDIQQVGQQFDSDLYPVDHQAFGDESDIDNNGVVIILLTPKVNALVARPACNDSFITGFFFGADLDPYFRASYNNGEVFFGMVPDPAGTVSCAYSTALVRRVITVTFIHEFQHMISFNQHALVRNGDTEVLWLGEALSHLAEELGGLHFDSLGIDTTASRFYIGDLYNAAKYLHDPLLWAPVTETSPGELAERGAAWLFVRYLTDRFGTQVPRALVNTSLLGKANVQAATGASFADLLGRWALALYVSDLPGFTAPADLTFAKWRFRTTFASLHAQSPSDFDRAFPLIPTTATGSSVAVSGTLRSGTGAFVLVNQSVGPGFSLDFRTLAGSGFPANAGAQLAVVRLQ